jgi:hypothetical protein
MDAAELLIRAHETTAWIDKLIVFTVVCVALALLFWFARLIIRSVINHDDTDLAP